MQLYFQGSGQVAMSEVSGADPETDRAELQAAIFEAEVSSSAIQVMPA